jgi:hypothetical protein
MCGKCEVCIIRTIPSVGAEIELIITPWSRVLLDKLTVNFAASQEIPRIYGT